MHRLMIRVLPLLFLPLPVWAQDKGWEKEWSRILQAAKKEGAVVVAGDPDVVVRQELPGIFKAKFGVNVEFIRGRSSEIAARLRTERQSGLYTVDVFTSGMQTMANVFYKEKMLDPLRPALILPEILDPSKWKRGKPWFMDPEEKYILRLLNYSSGLFSLNTRYARPEEFTSIKDLLHPKWKGKISAQDPTIAGMGLNTGAYFYSQFGEEFVKKLYGEQVVVSRDGRQMADWLAQGVYPISLDAGANQITRLQEEGFPVATVYILPDAPGMLRAGSGLVALANKAAHPNAARLFVNWIASREGSEIYVKYQRYSSTRNDVDESSLKPEEIPRPGTKYFDLYDWDFTVTARDKARTRIQELISK